MRVRSFFIILLLNIFIGTSFTTVGIAQNKNAKKWFKRAEKTNLLDEKISHYQKAISLDPSYAEAYYELGVLYAQRTELDKAMDNLGRALFARPTDLDDELRHKIVFEIGKIQAKLGRYREAKESLIGALNLARSKDARVTVLQQFAQILLSGQFFEEAIARYQELKRLDRKNRSQYNEALKEARRLQEIDEIYQQGLKFLKAHRFEKAIASFEKVVGQESKFRDAAQRLEEAKQQLGTIRANERAFHSNMSNSNVSTTEELANQITSENRLSNTASNTEGQILQKGMQYMKNDQWNEALQAFEAVLKLNPSNQVAANQIKRVQDALEKSMEERIVQKYYSEGLAYLKDNNWVNAIISFEKVLSLKPGHSKAKQNLSRAQKGLELAGQQSAKQRYYEQGMLAIQNEDWILAESLFKKLLSLDDQYKDVKTQMHFVQDKLAVLNQDMELVKLYRDGENYIRNGKWQAAVDVLAQVSAQNVNFRDVQVKLQFAREQLAHVWESARASQKRYYQTFWFWLLVSLALGILGFLIYSPSIRGRLMLILGLHGKAGNLYERLIDNGAMSDRLCLALLHLYLQENRKDKIAIKVYERALRLQLLQDQKEQEKVSEIVTQYYLVNWENEARQIDEKMTKILGS